MISKSLRQQTRPLRESMLDLQVNYFVQDKWAIKTKMFIEWIKSEENKWEKQIKLSKLAALKKEIIRSRTQDVRT